MNNTVTNEKTFKEKGFLDNIKIDIRTRSGATIFIPINNKVTILKGNSATGKTKLINYLDMLLIDKLEIEYCNMNYNNIIICKNKLEVMNFIENSKRTHMKNKVIIIDRFDTMSADEEIIDFIAESQNVFIVCAHRPFDQCGYNTYSMLGLKHDGINYEAYQLFKRPSDYLIQTDVLI